MAVSTPKGGKGDETVHYVPPRKQRKPGKQSMQPPLTPMTDVTFQLLLFFLLTCEFRESEGTIPGTLPAKGNVVIEQVETMPDPIKITLRPSTDRTAAVYEMSGVPVVITDPEDLYNRLNERKELLGSSEVPVIIQPDDYVPWDFVVEAFNQAIRAKYEKIGFAQEVIAG